MWKMVLLDYRYHFKEGVKREAGKNGYFFYLYLLTFPLIFYRISFVYYASFIPMLLGLLLSRMYGGERNKTLFLCPLSREERIKYFKTGYGIRTLFPISCLWVTNIILMLAGKRERILGLLIGLVATAYILAVNMYCQPVKKKSVLVEETYHLPGSYEVWNVIIQIGGILTVGIMEFAALEGKEMIRSWEWGLLVIMAIGYLLLVLRIIQKYYEPVMEQTVDYEIKGWQRGWSEYEGNNQNSGNTGNL